MKPVIAHVNASSTPDSEFPPYVAALQRQVSGDFAPYWGRDAELVFVQKGHKAPLGSWQMIYSDTIDVAGALGYHDWTHDGMPIGKIGIETSKRDGEDWRVTGGHETLEALADPDIVRCVFVQSTATRSMIVAYENCDPVQDKAYKIDGVPMTDFVTPEWFEPGRANVPFSFMKSIASPLTLAAGGYVSIFRVNGGRWSQLTARSDSLSSHRGNVSMLADFSKVGKAHVEDYARIPKVGSRRERRNRPRAEWLRSAA